MDLLVYSLLKKMVNGVATGLSKVNYDAENKQLVFTCNDSTILRISVPDGVSKKQQEMLSHMTLEGDEETGFYIAVDGERIGSKTCSFKTSIEVGALKSGTVLNNVECADVLEQILVAKYPPEIAFTSSLPTTSYYEIGEEKDVTLDIAAIKKSYDIKKLEISSTPSLTEFTKTVTTTPWTHSGTVTISDSQTVTVKATDIEGLNTTKSIKYNFVYPSYLGYGEATDTIDVIEEADVIAGMKLVRAKTALTTKLNSNDVLMKPMISYPKSFGELTSILDVKNGFEMLSNYDKKEIDIECLDGTMQTYYCYMQKTQAILSNFEIKFLW